MSIGRTSSGAWVPRVRRQGKRHYTGRVYKTREAAVAAEAALIARLPPPRTTYRGASLLPVAPFAAWLCLLPYSTAEIARELAVDWSRVARIRKAQVPRVSERTVERWGIALADNPRLVEQLYAGLPSSPSPG